ncbi:uncharacterized protein JN550_005245 [Neoarthrinium moseri]|uniref:uncharacterized protein n=1 Tax=Neoarthrinium moseri TaxID=1658444 RepID=UPI001FDCAF3D|nr:uncharacterized protein JN550_005245 [Neoarthrinium moseri]KAI1870317.1 hypothetical protein JN550_005245 [Neoarthrinium moseri]
MQLQVSAAGSLSGTDADQADCLPQVLNASCVSKALLPSVSAQSWEIQPIIDFTKPPAFTRLAMSDPSMYTVGWICAVGTELVAATAFLDEEHDALEQQPSTDNNTYILGRIWKHNVVIAALPHWQYGLVSAATVARDMLRSFPNVRLGLMVGIGGGAPSPKHDIRLGDIVVSSPGYGTGGVLQYDYGKTIQGERFAMTGYLNQPPQCLLTAISVLESRYESDGHTINADIERVFEKKPRLRSKYQKPDSYTDKLYHSSYRHAGGKSDDCAIVCDNADSLVTRRQRSQVEDSPMIHFGLIASASQLMQDADIRDRLSTEKGILCFEMEAAGLMNHFPCLVIRGICDYSDTHKNEAWQGYAAMAAGAYAKDLLRKVAPNKVEGERKLADVLSQVTEELGAIVPIIHDTQTRIEEIHVDKHRDNIARWLKAPDVSSNLNKALEARHPGSGQGLIQTESYQKWKTQSKSFLWLNGIPGCGKTILTATVIEDLRASSQPLLYFYFDFTDIEKQRFENTIRSLISQLYHNNQSAREELGSLYSFCNGGSQQPRENQLQATLVKMIQQSGEVWIILDALDECTSREELLRWLRGIRTEQVNFHILATSRPERDITSAIEQFSSDEEQIAIQNDLITADIRSYVHKHIREHEDFQLWKTRPDIQEEIESNLVERADGMFRWVWCQITALKRCRDPITLRKALASLPKTLDETYARILSSIPSEYVDHTIRILQFLTYSERPLRVEEAVDMIAVRVGANIAKESRFKTQDRMPIPTDIVGYCSSLVVLVRTRNWDNTRTTGEVVQLAHFSVRDYLTSDRLENDTVQYLQEMPARSSIAEVCLTYLLAPKPNHLGGQIPDWRDSEAVSSSIQSDYPFSRYSAQYWTSHAIKVEHNSDSVFMLAKELFSSESQFAIWCSLAKPDIRIVTKGSPIYFASLYGLLRCVHGLLENGANVNARGGFYMYPLQAASVYGHKDIVQLLLDAGADVNAGGVLHGNALQVASVRGHKDIVQLLLDGGADVNAGSGLYGNALQVASVEGHKDIVQLLLDAGANVNAGGGLYGNALQVASVEGHQDIVQLLLDAGADVEDNATRAALIEGHMDIVQLLLDYGAS